MDDPETAVDLLNYILEDKNGFRTKLQAEDFSFLSAGLLEDVVNYHGQRVFTRLELLAHSQPIFKTLLSGVKRWPDQMSDSDWKRLIQLLA